jgi:hypothetical protein
MIKDAYVCAINGAPELFATEDQALELAAEVSSAWYDAGADLMNVPRIAVMSVNQWFQAEEHLQLLEDIADYDRMAQLTC